MDIRKLIDQRLGMIAVKKKIISYAQFKYALKEQKKISDDKSFIHIVDILVNAGIIAETQQADLLSLTSVLGVAPSASVTGADAAYSDSKTVETIKESIIIISDDNLSAYVHKVSGITIDDVKKNLVTENIVYGIVADDSINKYLKDSDDINPFKIATGTSPVSGELDEIIYYFDIDPLKVGKITEDGLMDWKDRGDIPMIDSDELLAKFKAGTNGKSGTDIFGKPVQPVQLATAELKCGKGTTKSENGLECYSSIQGQPMLTDIGEICVQPVLKIKGDVGVKTGHIDFDGLVDVDGTIQKGYQVKAKGLRVKQVVGSEVTVEEDAQIFEGAYGSVINVGGRLKAGHIRTTTITAFGDINVQGEIAESKVETSGKCTVKGAILSSEILAKKGVNSNNIGSDTAGTSNLTVGIDFKAKREIAKVKGMLSELKHGDFYKKLEAENKELEEKSDTINLELGQIAQVQDKLMVARRNIDDVQGKGSEKDKELKLKIAEIDKKVEALMDEDEKALNKIDENQNVISSREERISELNEKITKITEMSEADKGISIVKASGNIFAGTVINGQYSTIVIDKNMGRIKISETKDKDPDARKLWYMKISSL